jgi:hypothetical protein
MRRFSSYGPVDTDIHYYVPRRKLIESVYIQLTGENPGKGGHYITVWAPRQAGKTWVMQQVTKQIRKRDEFEVCIISMKPANTAAGDKELLEIFVKKLEKWFERKFPKIGSWSQLADIFSNDHFEKPLILIIDEFDAINEEFIGKFVNEFRDMYISRQNESDRVSDNKSCLLHGLALIGVRSVLGIESTKGSPFNVQQSINIPNLTFEETVGMFEWYEKESGGRVDADVVQRVFNETQGQPGLSCWLGELLTEGVPGYELEKVGHLNSEVFDYVYRMAVQALPNSNILNIISKARQKSYRNIVLKLFKTQSKMIFRYDKSNLNFLYMNGVIDTEKTLENLYVRFSSPFVQKHLFSYFSEELFEDTGKLQEPFEDLNYIFSQTGLNIRNLLQRFELYLKENRDCLLKDAPRRRDLRIYEAVYHFILYRYLCDFLGTESAKVWPEFPTGNGKVDIIISYEGKKSALEIKSFTNQRDYEKALNQAANYAKKLGLSKIHLVFFVEHIDETNRQKYEKDYMDEKSNIRVVPVFTETGV